MTEEEEEQQEEEQQEHKNKHIRPRERALGQKTRVDPWSDIDTF